MDGWRDVAKILGTVVIMMIGFWMVNGREYLTRQEAIDIMQSEAVHYKEQFAQQAKINESLLMAIKENTKTLVDLRVEIAKRIGDCGE